MTPPPHIGVLALQGAFREHKRLLQTLGAQVSEVRLPQQLEGLSGLILPGGESTTIGNLMVEYGLIQAVRDFHASGGAIFGTCAGMILLARTIHGTPPQFGVQPSLDLMDITVQRNAFGRQVDSFRTSLDVVGLRDAVPGGLYPRARSSRRCRRASRCWPSTRARSCWPAAATCWPAAFTPN